MSMKNSNDTIRNRSRDLSVCSAVPQPLCHRVPPSFSVYVPIYCHIYSFISLLTIVMFIYIFNIMIRNYTSNYKKMASMTSSESHIVKKLSVGCLQSDSTNNVQDKHSYLLTCVERFASSHVSVQNSLSLLFLWFVFRFPIMLPQVTYGFQREK
jgi:hypothetical protein